jgi:phage terminase Nu1 subunit (DNA packaging protein)
MKTISVNGLRGDVPMEYKLMTSKELAEHFNVSMKTIQRWVDRGCPYKNPPGMTRRRFFRLDLVNEWLYSSGDSDKTENKETFRND